ncbi:MAG: choice-of-anchor D domain-containing protein [Rubrivivax sp.]|nr:choice-of-anchor D domain-containing protein [Rubrivivax sp.]
MKKRLMTLGAVLALLMGLGAAQAATYTVTNSSDSGPGSLRDAIDQANATVGVADTIVFSFSGTIVLASRLPFITDELTIDGAGRSITISGGGAVQVMINLSTLTLNALTIAHGRCDGSLFCSTGGAGVYSQGGTLTVTNSTFSGNTADSLGGGAIRGIGTLTIRNSTFSGNSSPSSFGGAIAVAGSLTQLTITNSTFANNSGDLGGALSVIGGAVATVTHSTLSGNATSLSGRGSAIHVQNGGSSLSLANNIVAGGGANGNCSAAPFGGVPPIDLGGNLSDDATCGFTQGTSASSTLAQLGPLQDNGGPTLTMLPLTGSPAIGQGVNQLAIDAGLATDQRGTGFARISGATVDRGAVEVQVPAASALTVSPGTVSFGTVHRLSLRYQLLTLKNNGTTAVTLNPLTVTPAPGTTVWEFTAFSLCPRTLAAGKSCTVKVVLFAAELGARAATLTIPSSASGSPLTVPLSVTVTRIGN